MLSLKSKHPNMQLVRKPSFKNIEKIFINLSKKKLYLQDIMSHQSIRKMLWGLWNMLNKLMRMDTIGQNNQLKNFLKNFRNLIEIPTKWWSQSNKNLKVLFKTPNIWVSWWEFLSIRPLDLLISTLTSTRKESYSSIYQIKNDFK